MRCAHCGFDSPDEMKFCGECGSAFPRRHCSQCGFANPLRFKFCGECGSGLSGQADSVQVVPAVQPSRAQSEEPQPNGREVPEAERRQLTVMFCDLVGSTALSEQLDPEDLREMVRAYQDVCAQVTERFAGHIAQYLGDGLLIYFGFPTAHEDDPRRAVRAGLGIVQEMDLLNQRLEKEKGIRLGVRLGIHTGMVVIGEVGGGARKEQLALGDTPNLAARVQGEADPDTVAISDTTYRLVEGLFSFASMGVRTLKGISRPVELYQAVAESEVQSRFEVAIQKGLTPLVGRQGEVRLLLDRWEQTKAGSGQVVLLSGEAGVGKSRLVQELRQHISNEEYARLECRCQPYYQDSAFYPVIDHLQRLLRLRREDTAQEKLTKLEQVLTAYEMDLAQAVPVITSLLSIPIEDAERYPPLALTPQQQKEKTSEVILAWLAKEAERQPLLSVWEDLHWLDPSSLEFLRLHLAQAASGRILIVLTFRPEFQPPWEMVDYLSRITLGRLDQEQTTKMVEQVLGETHVPADMVKQVVAKTDGVPLFVEELTKMVLESIGTNGDTASSIAIPSTLQDSLMARLDRLGTAKEIAQLGATVGRGFQYELLQEVASVDEPTLQQELGRLGEAGVLTQHDQQYTFRQTLVQDAAYQSLLKRTRQDYHGKIALTLEEQFPDTVETQPELVAHHYTEAGQTNEAVTYWQRAGQRAIQGSANIEAIRHLTKGLALLETLPDTPERAQTELGLQVNIGIPLRATQGFTSPELERAYNRARELCQQVGETPQLFPVLRGIGVFYNVRAAFQDAYEVNQQLLQLAQSLNDEALILEAHLSLGITYFYRGELAAAHDAFQQGIDLYDREQHHALAFQYGDDPGVVCMAYDAWILQLLGYPEWAYQRSCEAIVLGQEVEHPFSLALAYNFAARLHQIRGEGDLAREQAEATIQLSTEQGFAHWAATGEILLGWALAGQGNSESGLQRMHTGLTGWQSTGAAVALPHFFALQAEGYVNDGDLAKGLARIDEALTVVEKNGERYYEAELYRMKGEWAQQQSRSADTEECFLKAIEIAQEQQAKFWELRATTSLGRLWQNQGRGAEARARLQDIYDWFSEGGGTPDMKDARALLSALS